MLIRHFQPSNQLIVIVVQNFIWKAGRREGELSRRRIFLPNHVAKTALLYLPSAINRWFVIKENSFDSLFPWVIALWRTVRNLLNGAARYSGINRERQKRHRVVNNTRQWKFMLIPAGLARKDNQMKFHRSCIFIGRYSVFDLGARIVKRFILSSFSLSFFFF